MKIFLYIVIGLVVLWFIGGMIAAAIVGSKKNRGRAALTLFLGFSGDAKSMLFDIFKLHQTKKISEVNSIVEKTTNTTEEIISVLSSENRPKDFSSGKKFDGVTWTVYQKNFMENGYSELAASLLAGIFLFELDELLSKGE
ncbi:MAG: hypothetical protein AAB677_02175 [Patescibacteria group bacterium]